MFYDIFCSLCRDHGLKPGGAAAKIGFSRASINVWKNNGKAPNQDLLVRIADYFDVSTDYLLGKEKGTPIEEKNFPGEIELTEEEMRILSAFREMSPERQKALAELLGSENQK